MKKLIFILVGILALQAVEAVKVSAQVRATAQISATVVIPLAANEASQLNFGRFFPGTQGGTIIIGPDGAVTSTATVVTDASQGNPGSFLVSGEVDATFTIALPTEPATLANPDASRTMEVIDWVSIPGNGESGLRLVGGFQTIMVGATLKVGSLDENPRGIYTGSYQITFAYN